MRQYAVGPEPNQRDGNAPLYVAIGIAAVGGTYVYFKRHRDTAERLKTKVQTDEQEMRQRAREGAANTGSRLEDAVHEGEQKYGEVKVRTSFTISTYIP